MKGLLNLVNIIAFILIANITVAQCLLKEVPLQNKINQASVIIEGRVVAQSCFWNNAHNRIYTANEIAIFKLFKGNMKGNKIILITHGGIVGNQMERVSDGLELSIGDVGVFFTNSSNINASSPALTGGMNVVAANKIQSFAKYDKRSGTARDPFKTYQNIQNDLHQVIQTQLGNQFVKIKKYKLPEPMKSLKSGAVPVITSFTPDSVTAGNKMMITINGSDFEATQGTGVVSFANPDDGGATFNSIDSPQHYISWSDTKIEMYVANLKEGSNNMRSGSGVIKVTNASGSTGTSGGSVYVKYGRFEIYSSGNLKETDHVDKDGNGGYIFRQNPVFSAVSGRTDAITRAIETWRCKSFINWEIGTDTSVAVDVNDDVSIILWKTTTGSLAYARSYWSGCWNGSSFDWYVDEVDIVTDSTFTWNNGPAAPAGGEYDLESVMLHELGHGHQLGHVNQSTDVMYYSISSGTSRRTLTADDSLGGNYIVGMSVLANACGPSPMTALNLGNCTFCVTPPTLGIVGTDVKCNGGSDGDADLTPTGGTSPFTYVWSNAATTEDISGLVIGTYIVTVTDSAGCTVNDTITITQPSAIITSVIDTSVSCNGGSDGIADLTVSGGTPGYTYLWSTTATTEDVSGLGVGTHTVVVTDANACTKNDSAVITEPAALSSSDTTTNVSCNGGSDGAVDLTPSGGTTGYTYLWSNTATTQDISGLIAGTYTVVITDAYGCTYNDTAVITQPTVLGTSISGTDAICNGGSTGSVDLTVSGGTPAYSYLWSNSSTLEDPAGLTAGTYTITVTDANGCTIMDTVIIGQPSAITVTFSKTDASCSGIKDGTATATGAGGTPGYTYLWNSSPPQSTQTATGLGAGTYTVTVTDTNGCTTMDSVTINNIVSLTSGMTVKNALCNGDSNGTATVTVAGGTGTLTYLWNSSPPQSTQTVTGLLAGTYSVTVTDSLGCTITDMATVTEPDVIQIFTSTTPATQGQSDGTATVDSVTGGTSPFTYLWSNSQTTQTATGLGVGSYTVVVTDSNGCVDSATVTITELTDIADISRIPIVTIYPNPVEDQLFLVVMGESGHEIELNLVNILGENVGTEKVKLTGSSPQMVDVSNLPGGIYFIRIHEIGSVAKFIKAN
ncbi:MAG: T9SS type A sorting domain-containing protein [Bacteroidetes bacterium]|nr:T9SS type A sorting domain-containing protein [Bacteroidota bacterium]